MRTFHHLKLIEEIAADPRKILGQRSYSLMESFLTPYRLFLEVAYNAELEQEITETPSIEEFVALEFNEEHNRTLRFDFYLGLIAEDQRELLELAIDRIKRYETIHPLSQHHYVFKVKGDYSLDLRNTWLKGIFNRPMMYGIWGFAHLRAFLDGYFRMKTDYNIPLSEYEAKLVRFIERWKEQVNPERTFETWERVFLFAEIGTTTFTHSFNYELERFEEILLNETGMELIHPETVR